MLICDISVAHRFGKLALDRLLEPLEVCWQEMVVLLALHEAPDVSQALLAQLLQTDKGNVTKLLHRMEKKDLLTRHPCAQDSRRKRSALTPKGQRIMPALQQALADWESLCFAGLSDEDIRTYTRASAAIIRNTTQAIEHVGKEKAP